MAVNKGIATAQRLHPLLSVISGLSLGAEIPKSRSVIKAAVSGGPAVIGIVNVESSWGRPSRVCLCVKHICSTEWVRGGGANKSP